MKKIYLYISIILSSLVYACSAPEGKQESLGMVSKEMVIAPTPAQPVAIERKLIKTGNVEFETDDLGQSRKTILHAIQKYNGYTSSDNEYKSSERISHTISVRVPEKSFDQFLNQATIGVEKFDNKQITVQDVTEEFVDVEARIKTKKELENRYLDLLKKATKVSEMIEIETQLGTLRGDIESIEGRLNVLKSQVAFSTLTITFYKTISSETGFKKLFKNGFQKGWESFVWFFVFLVNVWPFILLLIVIIIAFNIWRNKKNRSV